MHLVFDLETTGLLPKTKVGGRDRIASFKCTAKYNKTRIVSISWVVLDKKLNEQERHYYVVKPTIKIPVSSTRIHGITDEYAKAHGVNIGDVLDNFEQSINRCDYLVSHNLVFDKMVLLSELYRLKMMSCIRKVCQIEHYCTMLNGQKEMSASKYPKLKELYYYLLDEEMDEESSHNALYDTLSCCKCYKALLKIKNK